MVGMPPAWANFGVGSWIERRARVAPDRVALVGGDRSFTYAELAGRVRRLANGLQRLGVGRGDRVAWLGPNHPAFLEAVFASGLVGAALAPVNHRLAADQLRVVLGDIEPAVLIQHAATDPTPLVDLVGPRIAVAGPVQGAVEFEALVAEAPDDPVEVAVGMDELCLLPHTSGTTEAPKGVMLETLDELRRYRTQIEAQAVRNKSMPLGNETGMTDDDRAKLGAWIAAQ